MGTFAVSSSQKYAELCKGIKPHGSGASGSLRGGLDPSGFEWINCSYHEESMVLYVRRSKDGKETLLFICNFDNVEHEKFRLGVPFAGKYKEIFNSDAREFGGQGRINARAKSSKKIPWDDRENSIECNIPPMSFLVFSCTPEAGKKKAGRAAKSSVKEAAAKKEPETGGRKTAW